MLSNGERKGRNSKLENFLRRKLKPNVYGDVRWYEPIVLRKDDSLSYKQVVITGEEILLVDTPPKEITTLLTINNITAVLMVHDLPEFLEGGLRDRTTHVLLKVKNDVLSSLRQKIRRASISTVKSIPHRRGSLDRTISEETSSNEGLNEDVFAANTKKAKWKRHLERRSSREILSFSSVDLEKISNLSKQPSSKTSKLRPPLIRRVTVPNDIASRTKSLSNLKGTNEEADSQHALSLTEGCDGGTEGGLSPMYGLKGEFGTRPISPALCEVLNRVESKCYTPNGRSITPDFSRGHPQLPRSASAFETYRSSTVSTALRSRSVLDKPLNLTSGTFPRRSQSSHNISIMTEEEEEDEVNFYTLSTSTYLFHLLHSLWMASLMSTGDDLYESNACLQLNQEGIDQTFRSLCSDLQEATSMEEHYSLLQDLLLGVKRYSNVRRVFWRDTEALSIIGELMREYCNNKSYNEDGTTYFNHRGNELKIVILVLQIIEYSLNHSQGCPFKAKAFKNKSLLEELLTDVFLVPNIHPPHNLMCKRFLCNFKQLSENAWQHLPERELFELIQKMIDASVVAAFQIMEAIFELGWSNQHGKSKSRKKDPDSTSLNILLQYVPVDEWLTYAMPKLLLLVQPRAKENEDPITKEEMILIYRYLSVLLALLKQSPRALAFCISNYSEELRYYVNESVLKRKLDAFDPLTPHTFRLAKSIQKQILR